MFKLLAIVVLVLGFTNRYWENKKDQTPVLSQNVSTAPSASPTLASVSSTPSPTQGDKQETSVGLIYPDSTYIGNNSYTTTDSPDTVLDWYKSYMEKNKFNIKTVVNTTTNGNTTAVIKATGQTGEMDIKITRKSDELKTTIRID
jgi:hypothetical protein